MWWFVFRSVWHNQFSRLPWFLWQQSVLHVPRDSAIWTGKNSIKNSGLHRAIPTLHWRHNERDDVSNQQRLDCLLTYFTGICEGNSPVTGEIPTQRASNAENVFIYIEIWTHKSLPHRSPVNSPQKGQWRGALMFSLICVWINGWVNNREADDLRRYGAHYDVIVMVPIWIWIPVIRGWKWKPYVFGVLFN